MSALRWTNRPTLRQPFLLAAFEGWTDAGGAATSAATHICSSLGGELIAEVEAEDFFDFTVRRPQVRIAAGSSREIVWPANRIFAAELSGGSGVIVMVGVEPHLRWRTFSRCVTELADELQVRAAFTLGSMLADVPHTRPVPVRGSSADSELIERHGLSPPRYQGPTGIVGVLQDAFAQVGIPAGSLMAQVPHYVPGVPSPKAARALVAKVSSIIGVGIATAELDGAIADYERQVNDAVLADDEIAGYVRSLESRTDEEPPLDDTDHLVSGDELAAQLEQFLREQDDD